MKYVAWGFGVLLAIIAVVLASERLAAERVEVIEVHGTDPDGTVVTTRLWVVDHEGSMYVRVGADGSGWYSRMQANPNVEVTRGDQTKAYTAIPDPSKSEVVNQLMQEKYTWGDTYIGNLVGGREGSIPILLDPVS